MIPIVIDAHGKIMKGTGGDENKKTSGDNLNYSIIMIGRNTEKSSGDLRKLAVTQAPVVCENSQKNNNKVIFIIIEIGSKKKKENLPNSGLCRPS